MSDAIARYNADIEVDIHYPQVVMRKASDGEWVDYDDHQAEVERLTEHIKERERVWAERERVAMARVTELEADPRMALTVADLRDAYACVAWMVSQETPDITGLDGSAAERLRRAALAAEKGEGHE